MSSLDLLGVSPFSIACYEGQCDVLDWLWDNGLHHSELTALGLISLFNNVICQRCIIGYDGWSPFSSACKSGRVEILDWLVAHGVDSSQFTIRSNIFTCTPSMMHLIFISDKNGGTPFWVACYHGHVKVMDWLVAHGLREDQFTLPSMNTF